MSLIEPSAISSEIWDVIVIGSGPAGLAFVQEYTKKLHQSKILLVEFGLESEPSTNALDESIDILNPENHHLPYDCTNKGLGGTSATWGGRCVSYDEIDFIPRSIIGDNCTWDLSIFEDVKRFYGPAAELLDCGKPAFNLKEIPESGNRRIAEGFQEGDWLDSAVERWSLPTRLGPKYNEILREASNVRVVFGIQASRIGESSDGVRTVELVDRSNGQALTSRGKRVVVAAGAQESTRILLQSSHLFPGGKTPYALGRFYQGHISGKIASIRFSGNPRLTDFGMPRDAEGIYFRRRFQLTTDALIREGLLNTAIWTDNPLYYDARHRSGTMSMIYLMLIAPVIGKKLAPAPIRNSLTKGKVSNVPAHLMNILRGFPKSLFEPFLIFSKRYLPKRKLPGVFLYSPKNEYALHFHAEQQPIEGNYMKLSEDGKRLQIQYGYTDEDVRSVLRVHEMLDAWLKKLGCGELVYWYPKEELAEQVRKGSSDGVHQVGTTRISSSAEAGVVDYDLKVWGTDDVYVCSSSCFPTSGQANPTFLLAAFGARLAHQIATQK